MQLKHSRPENKFFLSVSYQEKWNIHVLECAHVPAIHFDKVHEGRNSSKKISNADFYVEHADIANLSVKRAHSVFL